MTSTLAPKICDKKDRPYLSMNTRKHELTRLLHSIKAAKAAGLRMARCVSGASFTHHRKYADLSRVCVKMNYTEEKSSKYVIASMQDPSVSQNLVVSRDYIVLTLFASIC